ncbi:hypothetical protein BH10ACI2_BH10ACI2_18600 [soil metagenome]
MRIEMLTEAKADLDDGYWFYENQVIGLGEYFLSSIASDITSLQLFGGVHMKHKEKYRMLASRFPYSIFYSVSENSVFIHAVLDNRRNPKWISERLN